MFHDHGSRCVETLIPVSDPKVDDSDAIQLAAKNGHLDCVRELIPFSDPYGVAKTRQRFLSVFF